MRVLKCAECLKYFTVRVNIVLQINNQIHAQRNISMNFTANRDALLKPLQQVIGVVERRQTLPILSNVLLDVQGKNFSITGTDLEVELKARGQLENEAEKPGKTTLPGRKLMDIVRSIPTDSDIEIFIEKERAIIKSGRSRFNLTTLPADDFPKMNNKDGEIEFSSEQRQLRHLLNYTEFAMATEDVRYYLNGMLLEVNEGMIRTVATDGHRLAMNAVAAPIVNNTFVRVIIPRKGVLELVRLLENDESQVSASVSDNHLRVDGPNFTFTSKLIDGRFPDYEKVLPKGGDKEIVVERDVLKEALSRAAILSNEKFRGVRIQLRPGLMRAIANNSEHEEAEEELNIDYQGEDLDICFNVIYLIDVLNTVQPGKVRLTFRDSNSGMLLEEHDSDGNSLFVVMPMRL